MGERDRADEVRLEAHQPHRYRSMADRGFADHIDVAEVECDPALSAMELGRGLRHGRGAEERTLRTKAGGVAILARTPTCRS